MISPFVQTFTDRSTQPGPRRLHFFHGRAAHNATETVQPLSNVGGTMDAARENQDRRDVERVLAGDVEAFGGIVRRWQGPLINLAFRFCRDEGRAEEMAQEAFLRSFRFLDRWRRESAFSTWLFALALNVYRSQMRRIRLQDVRLPDHSGTPDPPDPSRQAGTREAEAAVRHAVSTLPAKYRDAIVLFYFLDLDGAEAAACLHIPEGSLKARLHRARELLRRRLSRILGVTREKEAS